MVLQEIQDSGPGNSVNAEAFSVWCGTEFHLVRAGLRVLELRLRDDPGASSRLLAAAVVPGTRASSGSGT